MSDAREGGSDRRRQPRKATLKTGRIIYRNATCSAECQIKNLSDGGASLQLADLIELPDSFELEFRGGPTRHCEVRWRRGIHLGVVFRENGSKP